MNFLTTISPDGNNQDPITDQELVTAYRQSGDLTILARLYQQYLDMLFGVCLKYLTDSETAKDAVMDIFEELAAKLLRHEVGHFKGWLYTLAKNHCLMQLRSSSRIKIHPLDPEYVQSAEEMHLNDKMEAEARLDRLSGCLQTLSDEQKTTVSLFYLENKCYKEIETITGFDWNKVRSLVQNGRRNLRICMQRHETAPTPAAAAKPAAPGPLAPEPLSLIKPIIPEIRKSDPEGKDPALAL